jgi:hypothetical protein
MSAISVKTLLSPNAQFKICLKCAYILWRRRTSSGLSQNQYIGLYIYLFPNTVEVTKGTTYTPVDGIILLNASGINRKRYMNNVWSRAI